MALTLAGTITSWDPSDYKLFYKEVEAEYGWGTQAVIAIEEMSELTKELSKNLRGEDNVTYIAEECADVLIMIEQIVTHYGISEKTISANKLKKLKRLYNRINN